MHAPLSVGEDQAVRCFRALSDKTRLRIIARLRDGEESVGHLAAVLGIGQSRLSFHLRALREAGLVSSRRQGRLTYYALDLATFYVIAQFLKSAHTLRDCPVGCAEASEPAGRP